MSGSEQNAACDTVDWGLLLWADSAYFQSGVKICKEILLDSNLYESATFFVHLSSFWAANDRNT